MAAVGSWALETFLSRYIKNVAEWGIMVNKMLFLHIEMETSKVNMFMMQK